VVAHFILRIVDVARHLGQRAVVPDGACQHIGHAALLQMSHDAVRQSLFLQEGPDRPAGADTVDRVKMIVMPVRLDGLGVDILTQRRLEPGSLQIMRGEGVPGQQRVHIAVFDQAGEGVPRVIVEGKGRPHYPYDFAMLPVMLQDLIELVIVSGKGGLAGALLSESEGFLMPALAGMPKGPGMTCTKEPFL